MADLFSAEWMNGFKNAWNAEPELAGALEAIDFNSTIAYGFIGDDAPTGVIKVENGKVVSAGAYAGEALNWDLRASKDTWQGWIANGVGMAGLGAAFATGSLKFPTGDYPAMIKDPRMAGPFVKSFAAMGKVA